MVQVRTGSGFSKGLRDHVHARASRERPCAASCTGGAWDMAGLFFWYLVGGYATGALFGRPV